MKKKIFGITAVICLIVLSIASTTVAYFTDTTDKTHTFTSGNVDVEFEGTVFENFEKAFPGQKIGNETAIKNVGSEDAYVGVIITLTNSNEAEANPTKDTVEALFGDLATVEKYVENGHTCTAYVVFDDAIESGEKVTVFKNITVPAAWDHNEMKVFNSLNFSVKAYATQIVGFENATDALTKAFESAWSVLG